jgi:hypothetical protein
MPVSSIPKTLSNSKIPDPVFSHIIKKTNPLTEPLSWAKIELRLHLTFLKSLLLSHTLCVIFSYNKMLLLMLFRM